MNSSQVALVRGIDLTLHTLFCLIIYGDNFLIKYLKDMKNIMNGRLHVCKDNCSMMLALGSVYTKRLPQRCDDCAMMLSIPFSLKTRVIAGWGCNPF